MTRQGPFTYNEREICLAYVTNNYKFSTRKNCFFTESFHDSKLDIQTLY